MQGGAPMTSDSVRLLTADQEARVFRGVRARQLANTLTQTLADARLRISLILLLTLIFWLGLFFLFIDAFHFLNGALPNPGTREQTVRAIFGVFFASLMVMLVFSSGIILYGGLFRSQEVDFLLTTPARSERIFLYKFQEAMLFSSWGFVLLGSPMLVAYGLMANAPWHYYAMLIPFLVAFIFIPGGIGALLCLLIVRWLPRWRLETLLFFALLALVAGAALVRSLWSEPQSGLMTSEWFQEMIAQLQFSQHRLLPSWWVSSGLLESAAGELTESMMFLALTFSNALVCHQLAMWYAGRVFRDAYTLVRSRSSGRTRWSVRWLDRIAEALIWWLPATMRHLIIKDLRLFRRDPVQWSQFFIFFGLLGLYFLNIRRLSYDISHATWVNMVSFLNVAVVGLILSTFTSRFIYPMISLEGRRFWILCRLPVERSTILWGKFYFSLLGSIVPCTALILISDIMLRVGAAIMLLHLLTCLVLCFGLCGIAVGLGARMPNLREESPLKIAAGFGGTLNLVISTLYIVVVVLLTAVPCHFYLATQQADPQGTLFDHANLRIWIAIGAVASLLLGAVATVLPLRLGLRSFRQMEF